MSRISINKASQDFSVSRNTLYKYIKQGKLTKDSEGKLDTSDLVRLFSKHVQNSQVLTQDDINISTLNEQLKVENEQLKQQLAISEMRINELKSQLEYIRQNETWLKQQLDQKLIEHKESKKGLLSKLFG
ncbi:helix-turn-helix domain-containing protein [Acinetobacter baumannii]|uniref:helix-turn-helix domain-containing protein n=1 Tax=Acinetobacter baumannii TaxID=470 RepID=UPI0024482ADE|nr:helix-turn-helix domain-containing protein [Acinetobacter baumannii]MDH2615462.1 helix-turn-helix domain-containing protein [Acinetobacter baumannii]MDH2618915.1 helix-turn-helix domain-containing protein [Acinetobacter baumannii]MDV7452405.1 helix-turn-helix domain-containing protein [Acinetobacter baumannii]